MRNTKLGQTVMTRGIANRIEKESKFAKFISESFTKYVNANWGDTCIEDSALNDAALKDGNERIVAKYVFEEDEVIFIITEWDRSVTTILFASEY